MNMNMMPVMFYRLDCKEIVKDWSKEKKINLLKKFSDVTLSDGKFYPSPTNKTIWKFNEVPNRDFTALKLYAWMQELSLQTNGLDVDPKQTKMVKVMGW